MVHCLFQDQNSRCRKSWKNRVSQWEQEGLYLHSTNNLHSCCPLIMWEVGDGGGIGGDIGTYI